MSSQVDNSLSEAEVSALIVAAAHTPPALGARVSRSFGTIYQAPSDGVVVAAVDADAEMWTYYHETNSTPPKVSEQRGSFTVGAHASFPVKENSYWKVSLESESSLGLWFIPLV